MNKRKAWVVGVGLALMVSLSWTVSSAPKSEKTSVVRTAGKNGKTLSRSISVASKTAPVAVVASAGAIAAMPHLAPPPFTAPAADKAMVTSIKPAVPTITAANKSVQAPKTTAASMTKTSANTLRQAKAPAAKPAKLFSYTRLLNYSPHPTEEEFLRDKPLILNGHKYWLKVSYHEGWDVDENDNGKLQNIAFNIQLMEGASVVRDLKLPAVKINAKKLKAGQIIGLAEVAPYKFSIAVDDFRISNGGISDLTFKFDMTS